MLKTLLNLLPIIGPATAALPEFKALYDGVVGTLHPQEQDVAKAAYQHAVDGSAEAHAELQELVRQHTAG